MIKWAGDSGFSAQYDYKLFPCVVSYTSVFLKSRYVYYIFLSLGQDYWAILHVTWGHSLDKRFKASKIRCFSSIMEE